MSAYTCADVCLTGLTPDSIIGLAWSDVSRGLTKGVFLNTTNWQADHIVPFIIDESLKLFYYRGLSRWETEPGYLRDTCLAAQDKFKAYLDYYRIPYEK